MHRCLDSFPLPYQRQVLDLSHLVDENLETIGEFMQHRRHEFDLIFSIARSIQKLSLFSTTNAPEFGPCHGDLHGGDVAYDPANNPTLFDFDSSGCGWRAYDIGIYPASVEWMDISKSVAAIRSQRLQSFLGGYAEYRTFSSDELDVVRASPAIRHIFLMGHVLKFTTITNGSHWANDDFIDWHMKWFTNWKKEFV
jgi:Ser/Thr protein kinase RdoA (MazF antagonist)